MTPAEFRARLAGRMHSYLYARRGYGVSGNILEEIAPLVAAMIRDGAEASAETALQVSGTIGSVVPIRWLNKAVDAARKAALAASVEEEKL